MASFLFVSGKVAIFIQAKTANVLIGHFRQKFNTYQTDLFFGLIVTQLFDRIFQVIGFGIFEVFVNIFNMIFIHDII